MFATRSDEERAVRGNGRPHADATAEFLTPLRLAAAHLVVATAAAAALERRDERPAAIGVAPLIVAPLAAAMGLLHARSPDARTATALRLLNSAVIVVGGGLLLADLVGLRDPRRRRAGSLGFAASGLLGLALERHASAAELAELELRKRASIVERLVPKRRSKLDRIVVHV